MFKRVVQVLLAVVLLAVVAAPNLGVTTTPTPVLIAGDDPGGGTGG